jgi:rubredoxin
MLKSNISGIGKWSKTPIDLVCDSCGAEKSIQYKLYTSYGYSNGDYFCRKCKMKKNNLEKWGVENPFQLESVKEKSRKTNLENFGVEL